jgi:hypothetical protein
MSAFADRYRGYMAECADAIDELMGERVILTPMIRKPNYQPQPERDKEIEVVAAFTWVSKTSFSGAGNGKIHGSGGTAFMLPVESRKPLFSFKANYLPFPLFRGYWIQRCVDASLWEVTVVKPDGVSRMAVEVVQLGLATQ